MCQGTLSVNFTHFTHVFSLNRAGLAGGLSPLQNKVVFFRQDGVHLLLTIEPAVYACVRSRGEAHACLGTAWKRLASTILRFSEQYGVVGPLPVGPKVGPSRGESLPGNALVFEQDFARSLALLVGGRPGKDRLRFRRDLHAALGYGGFYTPWFCSAVKEHPATNCSIAKRKALLLQRRSTP
jgi:hypothetical protein